MLNVFFRGYGHWTNNDGDSEDPQSYGQVITTQKITLTYKANGVFCLNNEDEIAYQHTKSLVNVKSLLPSTHSHDEFKKLLEHDVIEGISEMYPSFIFYIDPSQPIENLVIAEPDEILTKKSLACEKTEVMGSERNSMLKMILGMAIHQGYNPLSTKNTATGSKNNSIQAVIENCGLNLDTKTISKYLKEAAARFPEAKFKK